MQNGQLLSELPVFRNQRPERLAKAGKTCCFIVEDLKHSVELGDLQEILNTLGQTKELQLSSGIGSGRVATHQFSDPGTVNVSNF
jgi:hypothetical protein